MASAVALQVDREIDLISVNGPVRARVQSVTQRNWSRVAVAVAVSDVAGERGTAWFLKQFLDAKGKRHDDLYEYEQKGAEVGAATLREPFVATQVIASSPKRSVHAFDCLEMRTLDELLRSDGERYRRALGPMTTAFRPLIDSLRSGAVSPAGLGSASADVAAKQRDYGASDCLCFKGLDVRNIGVQSASDRYAVFDLGRPYLAPTSEACAKLVVSVGLLQWGRPLSLFWRGPDRVAVESALASLGEYVDPRALEAELTLQARGRQSTVQARSRSERWSKAAGLRTLGARYLRQLRAMLSLPAR